MSGAVDSQLLFALEARAFPQERARRTFESLVEAGERVFAEKGFDATQTPDIAARAGVSVGTFYRYFTDKMEIFLEVLRRHLVAVHEEVNAKLTPDQFIGKEKRQAIEAAIAILVDAVQRSPELQRVFLEMAMRDDRVAALKRASDAEGRQRVAGLIRVICSPEVVPDPDATAMVIQTSVLETALAIAGQRGPIPVSRERSLAALSDLLYRALFPSPTIG